MSELTIEQKISSLEIAIGILSRDTERRLRAFEGKQEAPVEDEKRKWDGLWVKIGGSEESPVLRSASLTDIADEATKMGLVVSRKERFYGDGIHEYTKPAPVLADSEPFDDKVLYVWCRESSSRVRPATQEEINAQAICDKATTKAANDAAI